MTAPLILIPGHLCGRWLYPEEMLPEGVDVLLADTDHDDTIKDMAARLLAEMPDGAVLAGLSMGAMVAMETMALAPERIGGVCLMSTDPGPAREREIAWRSDLLVEGLDHYAKTFAGRFFLHDDDTAQRFRPIVVAAMQAAAPDLVHAQVHALDTRRDMGPLIADFPAPVEVVVGAEDKVCPPRLHETLAAALPDATLTVLPDTGHLATLERPGEIKAILTRLFRRIGQNAP